MTLKALKYLLLLIVLALQNFSNASQELDLRLDIMKSVYQTSKKLELIDDNQVAHKELERVLENEYRKITRAILISSYKLNDKQEISQKVNALLKSVNYKSVKRQYLRVVKRLQKFIRQKGINYISYVALTNVLQITIPTVLMLNGFNTTAVFAFYILSDLPSYFYYRAGESYIYYKRMISLFGNKSNYIKFREDQRKMKNLTNINDNFIFYQSSGSLITIGQPSRFKRITDFIRVTKKSSLSLKDILNFAKENNTYDSVIKFIKGSKRFDENTKSLLMIHHLESTLSPDSLIKLKDLIGSFKKDLYSSQNIAEISSAGLKLQSAKSKTELENTLINIASLSQSKYQFFTIFQEIILPYLAHHSKYLNLEDFRNLSNNIYKFKADSNKADDNVTSESFKEKLQSYLQVSYQTRSSRCLNKLDDVFNRVLR